MGWQTFSNISLFLRIFSTLPALRLQFFSLYRPTWNWGWPLLGSHRVNHSFFPQPPSLLQFKWQNPSPLNICYPREIQSINSRDPLQATATSANWLLALNMMQLVEFVIRLLYKCNQYICVIPADGLTTKEEQPEDRLQPPKVGVRLENSRNCFRPFPQ